MEVDDMIAQPRIASLHYCRLILRRVSVTLGKGKIVLGKAFAECNTWQNLCRVQHSAKNYGEDVNGKASFNECQNADSRQRSYRVPR